METPPVAARILDDDFGEVPETPPPPPHKAAAAVAAPRDVSPPQAPASVEAAFTAMSAVLSRVTAVKELTVLIPTADKGRDGEISLSEGISLSLSTPMFLRESDCVSFIYDNRYLRINVTVGVTLGLVVDGERLECVAMMRSVPLPGTTWSFISFVLPTA